MFSHRIATLDDLPALREVMRRSIENLQDDFLSPEQVRASHHVMGLDTQLVIPLKRDAAANVVLNNLFKHTPLQTSFGVNMVALVDGVPRTLNLVQMLQAYIDHQVEVITRRSEFRLKKARDRARQPYEVAAYFQRSSSCCAVRPIASRAASTSG